MIENRKQMQYYNNLVLFFLAFFFAKANAQDLQDWGKYEGVKKEAILRIEKHRKGDATLKITLPNNKQAKNADVIIKLKKHEFKWGAVINTSFDTSPYSKKYKEVFLKYFNAAGFGLGLKPKHRGNIHEKVAEKIFPWLKDNGYYVRGHTITWEGKKFMRPEDRAILADSNLTDKEKADKLIKSLSVHFTHAIPKWDVDCWDVSNEPIANNDVNNLLPNYNTHAHWFKLADSIRRESGKEHVKLYQNDYRIVSITTPRDHKIKLKGYKAVGRLHIYKKILEDQIAQGAPIEGIGFQSRIKNGLITPDTIYNRLRSFESFNLPYHATEFEVRDNKKIYMYSDEERKLITEYMMVMYFSHPNVDGFWHWTFADTNSRKPLDYPLFNYDGTPKVTGKKWMELMDGFFSTDLKLTTDDKGEISMHGYYGDYELTTTIDGTAYKSNFKIISADDSKKKDVNLAFKP